jgi:hypothetical protein
MIALALCATAGRVDTVTLNRPDKPNAITPELAGEGGGGLRPLGGREKCVRRFRDYQRL